MTIPQIFTPSWIACPATMDSIARSASAVMASNCRPLSASGWRTLFSAARNQPTCSHSISSVLRTARGFAQAIVLVCWPDKERMNTMPKITLIGAGSVVFTLNLLRDVFSFPELAGCEIALMDIDPERLRIAELMAHKVAAELETLPTISAHADRRAALENANYVINTIQVGGYPYSDRLRGPQTLWFAANHR